MKNKNFIVGLAVLAILVFLTIIGWFVMKPQPTLLQGEVEATEVKVATKLVGRVAKTYVREGDKVKAGTKLMDLDSPEIHAKLQQAQAAKDAASAQSEKADRGARREQIEAAKKVWMKASAGAELAEKTFQRVENLYNEGVLPEQKRDEAETQLKAAKLTQQAARAQYDMARNGARSEDKKAAQALVNRAAGAVSEVESYLSETLLTAPIDGEVSLIVPQQGELVTPGYPVVSILDLSDIWITFNMREDLLTKMKMGNEFKASFPALGGKEVVLKVTYIKAQGSYATWRATKVAGDFDIKTFEVRAVPTKAVEGLRPGMTAVVNWNAL